MVLHEHVKKPGEWCSFNSQNVGWTESTMYRLLNPAFLSIDRLSASHYSTLKSHVDDEILTLKMWGEQKGKSADFKSGISKYRWILVHCNSAREKARWMIWFNAWRVVNKMIPKAGLYHLKWPQTMGSPGNICLWQAENNAIRWRWMRDG